MAEDRDRLLSIDEVAELLHVPSRTIYAWRASGYGPPAYRLGKHLRFRRDDVDAWLADRRPETAGKDGG